MRFTVLASGSAGNASLLQVNGFGLLLDAGIGPRLLAQRLAKAGASWDDIHAVLLSHTHGDHWGERTLAHLLRRKIPLYCHAAHHDGLAGYSENFANMRDENLVLEYEAGKGFAPASGLHCRPLALRHDCLGTFGFRFEVSDDEGGERRSLAYVSDLGSWSVELAEALADVDLLALEFNHDVILQQASGRPPYLIHRVLGQNGHLSNLQAAALLKAILQRSVPGRLRHVIQLHLSRDCNRPELARQAAQAVLADLAEVELYTARQDEVSPTFVLDAPPNGGIVYLNRPGFRRKIEAEFTNSVQRLLPGMG